MHETWRLGCWSPVVGDDVAMRSGGQEQLGWMGVEVGLGEGWGGGK